MNWPGERHRPSQCFRRRPVCHADLGQTRPAGQAQHHRPGNCQRGQQLRTRSTPPEGWAATPLPPGQQFAFNVVAQGRLVTAEQFGQIVVRANPDGSIVRLKDVARIELGGQDYDVIGRYNGQAAANMSLYQLPGSNALDAAKEVKRRLEELKKRFPDDIDYDIALDTTQAITEGMREIMFTFLAALALVTLVVFLFLQGWRATLIPLLAVPVSLIGTFAFFPMLGFSINTLSLFGLVLAVGLVVDDAIVVVECVERHIEEGLAPKAAALKAMSEVSGPVVAIALILAAVFVPTVFIPGITGRLYQQFAVTIAISVLISAFNALSLSPALSALLLRPRKKGGGPLGKFYDWFNRVLWARDARLRWFLRHPHSQIGHQPDLPSARRAGRGLVWKNAARRLSPRRRPGLHLCAGVPSLRRLDGADQRRRPPVRGDPEQNARRQILPHGGRIQSPERRPQHLQRLLLGRSGSLGRAQETGGTVRRHYQPPQHGAGQAARGQGQCHHAAGHPRRGRGGRVHLYSGGPRRQGHPVSERELEQIPGGRAPAARIEPSLSTTFLPLVPQAYVDVDRDKALKQGVDIGEVYQTLQAYLGGTFVNYFNRFGRQWQVYVEAEGQYRSRPEDLGLFYVRNRAGQPVPLSALASIQMQSGPEFTLRYNLFRSAQINGSAAPGYSSGQANQALEEVFAQTMGPEMGYDYMGMSFQENAARKGVKPAAVFGLSLLFVFLILAALYESWSLPFSVLLGTPIAVFGAFAALMARNMVNNVYAQIGLVMLIGLAAKNAILIVEFARIEYEKGKSLTDAALTGARIRLRPILMTSFAFIFGCIPLWIATGAGGVSRRILGTVVIGGMLAATCIAIFLIPVTFYVVEKTALRFKAHPAPAPPAPAEGEP